MMQDYSAYCLSICKDRTRDFLQGWDEKIAGIRTPIIMQGIMAKDITPPARWEYGPGHWACMMGHCKMVEQAIYDNVDRAFFCEDDAIPIADLSIDLPPGIIVLGSQYNLHGCRESYRRAIFADHGGWLYSADRAGLDRLLSHLLGQLRLPWDMYWQEIGAMVANPSRGILRDVVSSTASLLADPAKS